MSTWNRYVWFAVHEADVARANAAAAQLTGSPADLMTFVVRLSPDGSGPGTWRVAGSAFEEALYQTFKSAYVANFPGDFYYATTGLAAGTLTETNDPGAAAQVGQPWGLTQLLARLGLQFPTGGS